MRRSQKGSKRQWRGEGGEKSINEGDARRTESSWERSTKEKGHKEKEGVVERYRLSRIRKVWICVKKEFILYLKTSFIQCRHLNVFDDVSLFLGNSNVGC